MKHNSDSQGTQKFLFESINCVVFPAVTVFFVSIVFPCVNSSVIIAGEWHRPAAAGRTVRPTAPVNHCAFPVFVKGRNALRTRKPVEAAPRLAAPPGKGTFIVAMATDGRGRVLIGTEDEGLYIYDPAAANGKTWTRFTAEQGLGDNDVYAVAYDRRGRIWTGHLNHGVSIYNGTAWVNYDLFEGPAGERVFDIACSPRNGNVWIATSAGLTRYSLAGDCWDFYTRATGLPEDQASAIAFDPIGILYVGTQCHGIARSTPARGYGDWAVLSAPGRFGPDGISPCPLQPMGTGLPSNLINDIAAGADGAVYAATCSGVALCRKRGGQWRYLRGSDYAAKVRGLRGGIPDGWQKSGKEIRARLLPEDYVTCVAPTGDGTIWAGFRQKGLVEINPATGTVVKKYPALSGMYVKTIAVAGNGKVLCGTYGTGIVILDESRKTAAAAKPCAETGEVLKEFPEYSTPLRLAVIHKRLDTMKRLQRGQQRPAIALCDDWRTQGNWFPCKGSLLYVCCAFQVGDHHSNLVKTARTYYKTFMGPNKTTKEDSLRYWIHWLYTDNPRAMEIPFSAAEFMEALTKGKPPRRQSSWDDHGEVMPMTLDGPHLYTLLVGVREPYRLSLYFFNKDGHTGKNRYRDYVIRVKDFGPMTEENITFVHKTTRETIDKTRLVEAETLCRSRVCNFWGGVYKRFLLKGNRIYVVEIDRNYSFNTTVSGVFLDRVCTTVEDYHGIACTRLHSGRTLKEELMMRSEWQWQPRYMLPERLLSAGIHVTPACASLRRELLYHVAQKQGIAAPGLYGPLQTHTRRANRNSFVMSWLTRSLFLNNYSNWLIRHIEDSTSHVGGIRHITNRWPRKAQLLSERKGSK